MQEPLDHEINPTPDHQYSITIMEHPATIQLVTLSQGQTRTLETPNHNSTMCENPNPNPRPWDTPDNQTINKVSP